MTVTIPPTPNLTIPMKRWQFIDPADPTVIHIFERNPKTMSGGVNAQRTTTAGGMHGIRAFRKAKDLTEFTFEGLCKSRAEYDTFLAWCKLPMIWIKDHRGEVHEAIPIAFDPVPRRTGRPGDFYFDYKFRTMQIRKVLP